MRGHTPRSDEDPSLQGVYFFCATGRKDRDLRDRNNLLRFAWPAAAPAPSSSKRNPSSSKPAAQAREIAIYHREIRPGFPRSRVGLAWEPLFIQARSASKGNRDLSPRNQARIPSLARRACMEKATGLTRSCQLLDAARSTLSCLLPHPHPHRQHHERSARRELHERIGLGNQTLEPRHTGHSGQQRCPHESFTGEARA